jgi:hypothetical protein
MDTANEKDYTEAQWDEKIKEEMTLKDELKGVEWNTEEGPVKFSEFVAILRHCFWADKYMQMEEMNELMDKKIKNNSFLDKEGNAIENCLEHDEITEFLDSEIYRDLVL